MEGFRGAGEGRPTHFLNVSMASRTKPVPKTVKSKIPPANRIALSYQARGWALSSLNPVIPLLTRPKQSENNPIALFGPVMRPGGAKGETWYSV